MYYNIDMAKVLKWKITDYLRRHRITPYKLEKALGQRASRRVPYDWAKEPPERLHLDVLAKVLTALEEHRRAG